MIQKRPHKFSAGEIEILLKDVLHIKYKANRTLDVEDITSVRDKRIELIGKIQYYPIIDMTAGILKFTKEAKAWVAVNNEGVSSRVMDVFLVRSFVMKFKVRLYLALFKPVNETKVVANIEEAMEVIADHRQKSLLKSSA